MDQHSLQSPFLFQFYQKALNPSSRRKINIPEVEILRLALCSDNRGISAPRIGSGSSMSLAKSKKIKSIVKSGISVRKQSEILVNIIEHQGCKTILELGTSLGLNTIYLSAAKDVERVVTIEANAQIVEIAEEHFAELNRQNIKVIVSDIDDSIGQLQQPFDFIYIDANHTYEATLRYFQRALDLVSERGVIVLDDINWSSDMSKAWTEITTKFDDNLYLENDKIGIVFVNVVLEKTHYVLRF